MLDVVVAHSRGSIFTSYYLSKFTHVPIPMFVNVSGRLHMDGLPPGRREKYEEDFGAIGHSDWHVKIAGKKVVRRVTREGSKAFASWDNSYLRTTFPDTMDVLTIHGEADEIVPITGESNLNFDSLRRPSRDTDLLQHRLFWMARRGRLS